MHMRRVVITGVGLVTPVGTGIREPWEALLRGESGIAPIQGFDTTDYVTKFGGEVKGFRAEDYLDVKEARRMDPFCQYALAAAKIAMDDAGLVVTEENAENIGVYVGSGVGGMQTMEDTHTTLRERGPKRISPFFIPGMIVNLAPGHISMRYGMKGPSMSHVSACSTGAHAIGEAFEAIRRGLVDAMVCGGSEATVCPLGVGGFNAMKALSTRNEEPARASRPFDKERDGFVIAEGAGVMILEELEHARRRGATIYAELVGYGLSSDAHHMTAPSPGGEGAARCMKLALRAAGLDAAQVGYINAHGTSTPQGDIAETQAVKSVYGADAAKKVMVSSTKSMTGHMLGAAGGVEAIVATLAVRDQKVPPTINYEHPDPDCDLDYVPNTARDVKLDYAMSNAFGFGGTNSTLIVRRFA
jgi:3-oxoacyl-[acyl-carrier-protein] synthase II